MRVPDGLAHIGAHGACYVPVGVLSDLLGKSGPPCRVNPMRVDKSTTLAAGRGGGAWHA